MKKIFLFAAAAMVSLSSCVQTEEVYTGKMEEMGFKSAVTRAIIQSNDDMTYPIAVTAVWDDDKAGTFSSYFENAKFVYDAGTELWKGEPARYWPTSGDMQFIGLSLIRQTRLSPLRTRLTVRSRRLFGVLSTTT